MFKTPKNPASAQLWLLLLCIPVLVPHTEGMGEPPLTINWSSWHWLSVVSGWERTMFWISSLRIDDWYSRVDIVSDVCWLLIWSIISCRFYWWHQLQTDGSHYIDSWCDFVTRREFIFYNILVAFSLLLVNIWQSSMYNLVLRYISM